MRCLVIMVCLAGALSVTSLVEAAEWHTAIIQYTYLAGICNSLALDSQDNPHIAYTHIYGYTDECLRYAFWTGVSWNICDVYDSVSTLYLGIAHSISIALDSQNLPYIVFCDNSAIPELMYAHWDGTGWHIQRMSDLLISSGVNSSIAIDSQDHPYISYDSNDGLKYAHWTGSEWEIQVVDSDVKINSSNSLALDSQDYPHISYHVGAPYWDLRYAYWNGSEWVIQILDQELNSGQVTSLAINLQDYPCISYFSNPMLRYTFWDGSSWATQIIDTGEPSGYYDSIANSIALDNQDYPAIAYNKHNPNGYVLDYAHWDGSVWDIQQVTSDTEYVQMNTLALKSNGSPIISYFDYEDNGMLKIAWYGDAGEYPNTAVTLQDFSAQSNGDSSITLNWSVETTGDEQILGYNLYRYSVEPQEQGNSIQSSSFQNGQRINSALIIGRNPYAYIDEKVELGIGYEYRLEAVLADDSKTILGSCQATVKLPSSFAITKVYPNPADDYLTCVFCVPETGRIDLALYDLSGRSVLEKDLFATKEGSLDVQLDVGQLSPGLYTVLANQMGVTTTARLVIAR